MEFPINLISDWSLTFYKMEHIEQQKYDSPTLKHKAISGMIWSFFERFGYLFFQFVTNLTLARLLSPDEFGIIGILLIITNMAIVFVDSGLGMALVQKKVLMPTDISTIFVANVVLSIVVYVLIFLCAPQVAAFFESPGLIVFLRVIGLCIIIEGLSVVQNSIIQKQLDFRKNAIIRLFSILISSTIAIVCAFLGLGVWSLIIQHVLFSLIRVILLWISSDWKIAFDFNCTSFKSLYGYSSKLLISQLMGEGFFQFQSAIIGKYFSPATLGFYTQAQQLESIPVSTLSRIVNQVSFPTFSAIQDNKAELKAMLRKNIISLIFLNAPLMFLLAVVAEPLIVTLYTEKWIESVPIFRWLCLGYGLLLIVSQTNLLVLKAIGRSDVVLKLQLLKVTLGIVCIFCGIYMYGLIGLLSALTCYSVIEFFLNGFYMSKEVGYTILEQLADLCPSILLALLVGFLSVFLYYSLDFTYLLDLIITSLVYFFLYLSLSKILGMRQFDMYFSVIKLNLQRYGKN